MGSLSIARDDVFSLRHPERNKVELEGSYSLFHQNSKLIKGRKRADVWIVIMCFGELLRGIPLFARDDIFSLRHPE